MTEDTWPLERIQGLTKVEVQNLRANALARGRDAIVERCDAVLSSAHAGRPRRARRTEGTGMNIPSTAVAEIAELFLALPKVAEVQNAQNRLVRLANPIATFSELWRQYITCGFSSQEKSDADTPLGRFARGDSPLLDLRAVLDHGADPEWISAQLDAAHLNRMTQKKTKLLLSARDAVIAAKGADDSLVNGRVGNGLGVFLDLVNGRSSDRDIALSAEFSNGIDVGHLYGIGHKQIRNILVNSGLAHNVIPIDSRWKGFVGDRMHFEPTDLARRSRYLKVEDVIRQALIRAQERRDDIPSLAVLDAVVFAAKSADGHRSGHWTGA